ncbi:MAG: tRNA guanosine(34) transglycosylase Tgt [Bdellovibrionales bacterium]
MIGFQVTKQDGQARRGVLATAHGQVQTPAFYATATAASVKGLWFDDVRETGAEMIICNTYHLMVRPGAEAIAARGGLHTYTGWSGPIITDSGGFQVMSLTKLRKMSEDGVTFQSHIDGSKFHLTPERSTEIQYLLDSNITMAFDECTANGATHDQAAASMRMSMRWAKRSRDAFKPRDGYGQFGIQQGSVYEDLRRESSEKLLEVGFDGYAIGGLAIGEGQEKMFEVLDYAPGMLPADKPRYLMGVGKPDDIVGAVARGVDLFDCVMPTRSGRTGQAFTRTGTLNMKNAKHATDDGPIDATCACKVCKTHSRAYLHHLFKADEMMGPVMLSFHNLHFYQTLMADMRNAIEQDTFAAFHKKFLADYKGEKNGDND